MIQSITDYFTGLLYFSWNNFFYWFIALSLFFWFLEIGWPWRKKQSWLRQDFWLDGFYMFFNMYLFPALGLNLLASLVHTHFIRILSFAGIHKIDIIHASGLPVGLQLFIFFLLRDFVHFNIHRLLHRVSWLWEFHKVHHSVKEMGFAAHLRYHWTEGIFYRVLEYIPLAMLGLSVGDYTLLYVFTLAIGHFNHSNFSIRLGIFRFVLNNPQMHIWHHAKELHRKYGVNFGLTLSLWDYLFQTDYVPLSGRDIELGFTEDEEFPKRFLRQFIWPLKIMSGK